MSQTGDANRASTIKRVSDLLGAHYENLNSTFEPGKSRIPLSAPTFGKVETLEALDSLLSGYVTMGKKCRAFEQMVETDLRVSNTLFTNSGSSSNLLAVAALSNPWVSGHWKPGDEIITPAVTWSTTCWPLVQHGLKPIFVDVNPDTLTIDLDQVEAAITPRTRGLALVHLLGNPVDMERALEIAQRHDLLVFEDCCEALGARWNGKSVGTFGDAGSFSTYFSHHITTIEGGLMTTHRDDVAEAARALREHGWTRSLRDRKGWAERHPEVDDRFLFANVGYNLRPTEINGAFGIHQWKRLPEFLEARATNHAFWTERLKKYSDMLYVTDAPKGATHFSFATGPLADAPFTRGELVAHLEAKGIETRPIMTGNFLRHPAWKNIPHGVVGPLPVADFVSDQGLLWGNHHLIGAKERAFIADTVDEFMERHI